MRKPPFVGAASSAVIGNFGTPSPTIAASGRPAEPVTLALDLGQHCGWALCLSDGSVVSGVVHFSPGRHEGGGMHLLRYRDWLEEMQKLNPLSRIYFEQVARHRGTHAAHAFGAFAGILTSWAEERGIPYQGVPVGTIKKHITGKGNASKEAVIAAVREKGYAPTDDNESDALALLFWSLDQSRPGSLPGPHPAPKSAPTSPHSA